MAQNRKCRQNFDIFRKFDAVPLYHNITISQYKIHAIKENERPQEPSDRLDPCRGVHAKRFRGERHVLAGALRPLGRPDAGHGQRDPCQPQYKSRSRGPRYNLRRPLRLSLQGVSQRHHGPRPCL